MAAVELFDAHCYVGRYKTFQPGSFHTVRRLLEEMDHLGIAEALVMHSTAREHHPEVGNALTLEAAERSSRLYGCWSFLPSGGKEIASPQQFVSDMLGAGVRAVKLFCGQYTVPLSGWAIRDYLAEFERHNIPMFVDPDNELSTWAADVFDWDAVDTICRDFRTLPVILQEARFRSSNRLLYKLLERHPNLRIELSGLWGYRSIEFICREFGAGRILFGTRLPVRDGACAVAMVAYAEIGDEEKQMVAGGNLRTLMQEVKE